MLRVCASGLTRTAARCGRVFLPMSLATASIPPPGRPQKEEVASAQPPSKNPDHFKQVTINTPQKQQYRTPITSAAQFGAIMRFLGCGGGCLVSKTGLLATEPSLLVDGGEYDAVPSPAASRESPVNVHIVFPARGGIQPVAGEIKHFKVLRQTDLDLLRTMYSAVGLKEFSQGQASGPTLTSVKDLSPNGTYEIEYANVAILKGIDDMRLEGHEHSTRNALLRIAKLYHPSAIFMLLSQKEYKRGKTCLVEIDGAVVIKDVAKTILYLGDHKQTASSKTVDEVIDKVERIRSAVPQCEKLAHELKGVERIFLFMATDTFDDPSQAGIDMVTTYASARGVTVLDRNGAVYGSNIGNEGVASHEALSAWYVYKTGMLEQR